MQYFKKFDFYGKNVTFFYGSSTFHRTIFGGLLSIFTFTLMATITITSLYSFLYQKPVINSNVVFFINKKFEELEGMEIKGQITNDMSEFHSEEHNTTENQLEEFLKYYRIVLHEKYYDELENYQVAKITKLNSNSYQFNVEMHISDVFKEKEFSTLRIISCNELLKNELTKWPYEKKSDEKNENNNIINDNSFDFDNSASMCLPDYENYYSFLNKNNLKENSFIFSFDTPIYTVDRKGDLHKVPHLTQLNFRVKQNFHSSYSMDTKYVVIEDDSNIYYSRKKYDAYFTMKHPVLMEEKYINYNDFSMDIDLQNKNNEQIILITIYKYKLMDILSKLGGIMKIITFMKMTGKFWSSFFYEKTLYNLLVKRENPYLSQKKKLLESLVYKNANKLNKEMTPESGENKLYINKKENVNSSFNNLKNDKNSMSYASYTSWFLNRFCKCFFIDSEAKKKREMLAGTLGLNNYLLHLDYIDRQILLEQHTGDINEKIEEIINKNREKEMNSFENNDNDNTGADLKNSLKGTELSLIDHQNENNLEKPLNLED